MALIRLNHVAYSKGNGRLCCHVDAIHATPPAADLFTEQMVALMMAHTGCAGIISTTSRLVADLNRTPCPENHHALQDYRFSIRDILDHLGIIDNDGDSLSTPYLHLAIHGMRDHHHGPYCIEIGTRQGQSCSSEVKEWFTHAIAARARVVMPHLQVVVDKKFTGDESIVSHRLGDGKNYRGYGQNFNTFQVEISRTLREYYLPQIVELLSLVIFNFQATFVGPHFGRNAH
jgi:hypothetical protein